MKSNRPESTKNLLKKQRNRFFSSTIVSHNTNRNQKNKQISKINTTHFLYHCLSGFDLYKLSSILENGILSKNLAESKGIKIDSTGLGYNGTNSVSVSTHEVLDKNCYTGAALSVVINPANLSPFHRGSFYYPEGISFERQIDREIPPQNIVGIMIPDAYLTNDLENLHVFNISNQDMLQIAMNNLNKFMQDQFHFSMLSDPTIKKYYDESMSLEFNCKFDNDYDSRREKLQHKLNSSVMQFIENLYKNALVKKNITSVDIISYHTKDKLPLYKLSGECINNLLADDNITHQRRYAYPGMRNNE